MRNTETADLAMYFSVRDNYGTPYFEIRPVRVKDGTEMMPNGMMAPTIENLSSDHELDNLTVYSLGSNISWRDMPRQVVGPFIAFAAHMVELRDAERMAKVLSRIDRALNKAYEREGSAAHLGQYMMRVARAVGITRAVWRTDDKPRATYPEMRFRIVTLATLSDRIAQQIAEYERTGETKAAA